MPRHDKWIEFAEVDLKTAYILIRAEEVHIGPILYSTQQCAEKALKAYLVFKRMPIRKTHDLIELLNLCTQFDVEFDYLTGMAANLMPYASQSRYPDDNFLMPSISIAESSIEDAYHILNFVKSKV